MQKLELNYEMRTEFLEGNHQKYEITCFNTNYELKKKTTKGAFHIRKCPLQRFREFVKMVGYDGFVGIIE